MAVRIPLTTSYEDAVRKLGSALTSSGEILTKAEKKKQKMRPGKQDIMRIFVQRSGLSLEDVERLPVIHIAGTKGKGSTCAYCESICRAKGYKTGMFTSPYIVESRERIRVNGRPVDKEKFARYFWKIYCKLKKTETNPSVLLGEPEGMPAYFCFTVIMALHVFLDEKVDVAIFEVGVGGEHDYTNFFRRPVACGITCLGYDHCSILGYSIGEIAWHKAGIFKKNCPAITVEQVTPDPRTKPPRSRTFMSRVQSMVSKVMWYYVQALIDMMLLRPQTKKLADMSSMEVLLQRAKEKQCPLYVASALSPGLLEKYNFTLGIDGKVQVSERWTCCPAGQQTGPGSSQSSQRSRPTGSTDREMETRPCTVEDIPRLDITQLDPQTIQGLSSCSWSGRTQTVSHDHITYFLDGAHTVDSMKVCASWFQEAASKELSTLQLPRSKVSRVLLYNITGGRRPTQYLQILKDCDFDAAIFCPNVTSTLDSGNTVDLFDIRLTTAEHQEVTEKTKQAWLKLCGETALSHSFSCVEEALTWATQDKDPLVKVRDPSAILPELPAHLCQATRIQVLVTGSLLLVGNTLTLLQRKDLPE